MLPDHSLTKTNAHYHFARERHKLLMLTEAVETVDRKHALSDTSTLILGAYLHATKGCVWCLFAHRVFVTLHLWQSMTQHTQTCCHKYAA